MRLVVCTALIVGFSTGLAGAMPIPAGSYICTVEQRAGIGRTHVEGAPGPTAFVDETPSYRFRIAVVQGSNSAQIITERPYDGPDRSMFEWHTPNSTLHEAYLGSDGRYRTADDLGFLNIGVTDESTRELWFYHSAFEYPGGEDVVLGVRYGRCEPE